MRAFGFSTGTLARSDVRRALQVVESHRTGALEYSALRIEELESLVEYLLKHGIGDFRYVSLHAPSRIAAHEEAWVVTSLQRVAGLALKIVVHPDTIHQFELWRGFGDRLCVENMDHRKPIGRTTGELGRLFDKLPEARLCFDIGHAHEIDRSMSLGYEIVRHFGGRIAHLHASEVSDECQHRAFSPSSHAAFRKLASLIPNATPIILETDVPVNRVESQLREAKAIFGFGCPPLET